MHSILQGHYHCGLTENLSADLFNNPVAYRTNFSGFLAKPCLQKLQFLNNSIRLVRQPCWLSPKSLQNAWRFAFLSGSWPSHAWLAET
jgi:hypothetical protein